MILKRLYVYSFNQEKLLRDLPFNENGVNIILGEKRDEQEESNGAGKSTLVDCISFLLGNKISSFYEKSEKLLEENIFIILEINSEGKTIFLGRSFNSPKFGYYSYSIKPNFDLKEWERISDSKYKEYVDKLALRNKNTEISFASVREYIIRDEKKGFNDIYLSNRKALKNHQIVSYLFTLPSKSEEMIGEYKNKIDLLTNQIKSIESMNINLVQLKVREEELRSRITELNSVIEQTKTLDQYDEDTENYSQVKEELNIVQKEIFEVEHIRNQYNKNIDDLKLKVNEIKEFENIEEFYHNLVEYFPSEIKENYEQIKEFYNFMVESRGSYFTDKIRELNNKLEKLYLRRKKLEDSLEEKSKIINSSTFIEDISIIMDKKRDVEVELAEVKMREEEYNKINDINNEKNDLQQQILRLNSIYYDEFKSQDEKINKLKKIFRELMQIAYGQVGSINFEYDNKIENKKSTTGRVKITCSIPDERSHGRLYMKINIFDLTWFLYRCMNNYNINFLIHDGSYSKPDSYVKGTLLKYVDHKLKNIKKGQYFVTLNESELLYEDIIEFEKRKAIVAKLDRREENKNRFFGFKF